MKFYHGTTFEAATNILANGFEHSDTVWDCSNANLLYLVSQNYDNSEYDETHYIAREFASTEALIAAAKTESASTTIAIFEFDIPNELIGDTVMEDDSCENMDGCYQIFTDDLNSLLNAGVITAQIHWVKEAYQPYLRPFYLTGLSARYMSISDPLLQKAIDLLRTTGGCGDLYEDLFYVLDDSHTSTDPLFGSLWLLSRAA